MLRMIGANMSLHRGSINRWRRLGRGWSGACGNGQRRRPNNGGRPVSRGRAAKCSWRGEGAGEDFAESVEQEIGVAAHLYIRYREKLRHQWALDLGMGTQDEPPDPQHVRILGKPAMRQDGFEVHGGFRDLFARQARLCAEAAALHDEFRSAASAGDAEKLVMPSAGPSIGIRPIPRSGCRPRTRSDRRRQRLRRNGSLACVRPAPPATFAQECGLRNGGKSGGERG